MRDRWIYVAGDSTLRQQFGLILEHLRRHSSLRLHNRSHDELSFDQLRAVTRGEVRYADAAAMASRSFNGTNESNLVQCRSIPQPTDWEYRYPGPTIGPNEKTTSMRLREENVTLTFDWKMHVFRRYDRWLLTRRFARTAPDVLVISAGVHDCFWNESHSLGPEHHRQEALAALSYLAAHLPSTTELVWVSAPVNVGSYSDYTLPTQAANFWAMDRRTRSFFHRGAGPAHLRCVQAINRVAADAAREEGWFTFVDRELLTHAVAHLALRGRPPHGADSSGEANEQGSMPQWRPAGATADDRASIFSQDGVHYSEASNTIRVIDHYLREALACVLARRGRGVLHQEHL